MTMRISPNTLNHSSRRASVVFVWSNKDQNKFVARKKLIYALFGLITGLAGVVLFEGVLSYFFFNDCSWRLLDLCISPEISLFIILGAFIVICIAVQGVVTFTTENLPLIRCFLTCFTIYLCASVLLGIWIFTFIHYHTRGKLDKKHMIPHYRCIPSVKQCWDDIQFKHQCCGWDSYTDWSDKIPQSCCDEKIVNSKIVCQGDYIPSHASYEAGCFSKISFHALIYTTSIIVIWAIIYLLSVAILLVGFQLKRGVKVKNSLSPFMGYLNGAS